MNLLEIRDFCLALGGFGIPGVVFAIFAVPDENVEHETSVVFGKTGLHDFVGLFPTLKVTVVVVDGLLFLFVEMSGE